jgi:two-component system, NarL family, sensor histidine kinase UhpB
MLRGFCGNLMWHRLSLRTRLNLLVAVVLVIGLAANIARLVLEAGSRVQAEDQSVTRLAGAFAQELLSGLNESDVDEADLRVTRAFEGLERLRHVRVRREGGKPRLGHEDQVAESTGRAVPPSWFVALVKPEPNTIRIPLTSHGNDLGSLVIGSEPSDEISEIWDGIVTQLVVGASIALVLFLITAAVVSRALRPLNSLAGAMTRVEAGDYSTRVALEGPPELAAICRRLNHLVEVLGKAMEDRRRLAGRIVSLQDSERKEVAGELHDEFGPYLFALRAHLSSLEAAIGGRGADAEVLLRQCRAMAEQLAALQRVNRHILERLRPIGLADLGLGEALNGLAGMWRQAHPDVSLALSVSPSLGALDETTELTIYRVVQEALTNVFRHAGASSVDVSVAPMNSGAGQPIIRVEVRDNGSGLAAGYKSGLGTIGMRERVSALGGSVSMNSTPEGLVIEALVPARPAI